MILVEIRPRGGKKTSVALHPKVTVLGGLDEAGRKAWANDLAKALQGGDVSTIDVAVDLDGRRQVLTPEVARRLGLSSGAAVTVFPDDLPGAKAATTAPPDPPSEAPATADADADLRRLREQAVEAERAILAAAEEIDRVRAEIDTDVVTAMPGLEATLETARAAAATARRELADLESSIARVEEEESAGRDELRSAIERLQRERSSLEAERTELVGRMVEVGDPGDPKAVEEALNGLRRLQSVKPKPSTRAIELADAWRDACSRLAALPAPPQPPEWLVAPALDALQEAREAVSAAEAGSVSTSDVDPEKVAALDRAHREVLEAEQRAMKKGSRANRKRLDAAHEAESAALSALGVSTYGAYLQRIAPNVGTGRGSGEDRRASAQAALADAEAVWEELHGGQASPEWTEAKQQQAAVRQEAVGLLGADIDDADLEAALRDHLENVVDTAWAERALLEALRGARAEGIGEETDLDGAAERWLADSPRQRETRAILDTELTELDARLGAVEKQLTERQANAFFGDDEAPAAPKSIPESDPVDESRRRVAETESAERDADAALTAARQGAATADKAQLRVAELERQLVARQSEADDLRTRAREAEAALAVAAVAAAKGTGRGVDQTAAAASNGSVDLSAVVGMEAEAYLLARVAALRGAAAGPLPLIVDAAVLTGLSERAAKRVFRLLGRLADSMQLVVLGDGGEIANWAEGLGDQAIVRSVAR
ncbi:MAG TPA: hypothetical protein VM143_06215 [Acidimicrobiales bacterium]|nr:hypothetical protein [Acidimicrobiales bacterium]